MFRFSTRELLLLTLVVGTGIGWWADRRSMQSDSHRLALENEYLKDELLELQFPNVQQDESPAAARSSHTLEWYPPNSN